jgi:hypothetical protein
MMTREERKKLIDEIVTRECDGKSVAEYIDYFYKSRSYHYEDYEDDELIQLVEQKDEV